MQPLSELMLNIKATTDMVSSFISYLQTLTPTELTTFYCEVCHGRLATDSVSRPGNPFHESRGICSCCDHHEDVSNPAINRFLNENGLTLECNGDFLSRFGDCSEQLTWILQHWLTPTDFGMASYLACVRNDSPAEAWVMYGRKKAKEVYKASSLGVVYKVMLLAFYPDCYSIERFNADPIGSKIDETVNNKESHLSEPEELPALFTVPTLLTLPTVDTVDTIDAVYTVPTTDTVDKVNEADTTPELPSKPTPHKGWLSRVWAFFQ